MSPRNHYFLHTRRICSCPEAQHLHSLNRRGHTQVEVYIDYVVLLSRKCCLYICQNIIIPSHTLIERWKQSSPARSAVRFEKTVTPICIFGNHAFVQVKLYTDLFALSLFVAGTPNWSHIPICGLYEPPPVAVVG
jgi:hypothetical protein